MFMTAVDFVGSAGCECRKGVGNKWRLRGCSVYVNHPCVAENELLLQV